MSKPTIAIVDADSICYSAGYCEHEVEMQMSVAGYHQRILEATRATEVRYFVEAPTGKANYRHHIAITKPYKGSRKGRDKPPYMVDAKRLLRHKYGATFVSHMESEDAATISAYEYGREWVVLCAIDKDTHCHGGIFYDYRTGELLNISDDYAEWHLAKQMLMGDSVDCIPGLKGVGNKRAEGILDGVPMGERFERVAAEYIAHGHGYAYLIEQSRLVYILKKRGEVFWPVSHERWCELEQEARNETT